MKKVILFLSLLSAIVATFLLLWQSRQNSTHSIHYHAGFVVYTNGVKQDFSNYQYMNFTPCTAHNDKKSPLEEQIEKAHLHDNVGDVVHVHRQGAIWQDLFQNLKYSLPNLPLKGYVNGVQSIDILNSPILADESVIFVIGNSENVDLSSYVTLDHIHEVESKSELCGTD